MGLIKLKCPSCGADIQFDGPNDFGFCTYCGTKVMQEKTIIEHKGEINVTIQKPVKIVNNDFETKFANAKNWAKIYFDRGPNLVMHGTKKGYDAVVQYFSDAELVGANESRYYTEFADFYVRANLEGIKNKTRVLNSRDTLINHYIFCMDNAISYSDDEKEKQALTKKKNDTVALLKEEIGKIKETKAGCYIATCVYGSYDCKEVWTLRRYRDNTLSETWYGRLFIQFSYTISPILVNTFGNTQHFKRTWQRLLDRIVDNLRSKGVDGADYTDR